MTSFTDHFWSSYFNQILDVTPMLLLWCLTWNLLVRKVPFNAETRQLVQKEPFHEDDVHNLSRWMMPPTHDTGLYGQVTVLEATVSCHRQQRRDFQWNVIWSLCSHVLCYFDSLLFLQMIWPIWSSSLVSLVSCKSDHNLEVLLNSYFKPLLILTSSIFLFLKAYA